MAITITSLNGGAAKTRSYTGGAKPVTKRYYTVLFDSSYPTGGESISTIFDDFKEVLAVFTTGPGTRLASTDYTADAEKLLLYTAVGTEASNGSDQSSITMRLEVVGYA